MTHISTQFHLEAMPLDAYLTFLKAIRDEDSRSRITDLNFGWMFDIDDSIYDDRNRATDRFISSFADHFDKYRPLYHKARQLTPIMRRNHRIAWDAFYPKFESHVRFMAYLEQLHDEEAAYRHEQDAFGFDVRLNPPMLDRFRVQNMGSWGVAMLEQARESAERIIRDGSVILHKHYERTGWRFLMRHPLAMGGVGTTDRLLLKREPINVHLSHYLGTARTMVYDLIQGIEPTTWSQHAIQGQFNMWMDHTATAVFTNHVVSSDLQWMLTPKGLPSVLALPSHTKLPVTIESKLTPSIDDEWQLIQHTGLADVIDGTIRTDGSIDESILRLGWLMCMAATILSMNIKVGTGQERLRWIHSTINAAHIGEAMMLAPMILHKANEAANA